MSLPPASEAVPSSEATVPQPPHYHHRPPVRGSGNLPARWRCGPKSRKRIRRISIKGRQPESVGETVHKVIPPLRGGKKGRGRGSAPISDRPPPWASASERRVAGDVPSGDQIHSRTGELVPIPDFTPQPDLRDSKSWPRKLTCKYFNAPGKSCDNGRDCDFKHMVLPECALTEGYNKPPVPREMRRQQKGKGRGKTPPPPRIPAPRAALASASTVASRIAGRNC